MYFLLFLQEIFEYFHIQIDLSSHFMKTLSWGSQKVAEMLDSHVNQGTADNIPFCTTNGL